METRKLTPVEAESLVDSLESYGDGRSGVTHPEAWELADKVRQATTHAGSWQSVTLSVDEWAYVDEQLGPLG